MPIIEYPLWADTKEKKWLYCSRMIEKLRLIHNGMGRWYRVGLSQSAYDKLPQKIRTRYPFVLGEKLSQAQWNSFVSKWEVVNRDALNKFGVEVALAGDDDTIDVDYDRDVDDGA